MPSETSVTNTHTGTAWRGLFLRLIVQRVLLAGLLPLNGLAIYLLGSNWYLFTVPYVLAWLLVGYLLNEWKCPSCLRSFLKRGQYGQTWPAKIHCINCGLGIGEQRDPNRSARGSADLHFR